MIAILHCNKKKGIIERLVAARPIALQSRQQSNRLAKSRLSLVCFALLVTLICAPARKAESSSAAITPEAASPTPQAATPSASKSTGSFFARFPKRLVAFTVGTTVGTPIALVRCTEREIVRRTKEAYTLGNAPKPLGYVTSVFFGVPSGVMYGAFWGTANGVADSWVNADDKAFSKSSYSLEKLTF